MSWGDMKCIDEGCEHVRMLRAYLKAEKLSVYSEHGENPQGWVNASCERCRGTYETLLQEHPDNCEQCGEEEG